MRKDDVFNPGVRVGDSEGHNQPQWNLGLIAYKAYGEDRGWKTHDGRDMPEWVDLGAEIRHAWEMAAMAVAEKVRESAQ